MGQALDQKLLSKVAMEKEKPQKYIRESVSKSAACRPKLL